MEGLRQLNPASRALSVPPSRATQGLRDMSVQLEDSPGGDFPLETQEAEDGVTAASTSRAAPLRAGRCVWEWEGDPGAAVWGTQGA